MQAAKPDAAAAQRSNEISATDLFANAESDRLGGKLDLALQEYTDYVAKFGDTAQAADAQYYIGSIHYSNQEWDRRGEGLRHVATGASRQQRTRRKPCTIRPILWPDKADGRKPQTP